MVRAGTPTNFCVRAPKPQSDWLVLIDNLRTHFDVAGDSIKYGFTTIESKLNITLDTNSRDIPKVSIGGR